jgi:CheY-like chemotaxis protein
MTILLAENVAADISVFEKTCRETLAKSDLRVVTSGEQAISYLAGKDPYADRSRFPLPSLVFLDVFLPGKGGLEVLEWIRLESDCKGIPVILIAGHPTTADIQKAYDLYSNSFLSKTPALTTPSVLENVLRYWAFTSETPNKTFVQDY